MIGVTSEQQRLLREIFKKHVPGVAVWIFGSRVNGPVKPSSDLDVALYPAQPVPLKTLAQLEEELRESALPFRVDCVDILTVDDSFKRIIEALREPFL